MPDTITVVLYFIVVIISAILVFYGVYMMRSIPSPYQLLVTSFIVVIYAVLLITQPGLFIVSNVIVLLVAISAGSVLGKSIGEKNALIVFLITASIVDFVSFSDGLTNTIISNFESGESSLLLYLVISIKLNSGLVPIIGVSDLFILAVVFHSMKSREFNNVTIVMSPLIGLLVALAIGILGGGIYAIPFIALSTISTNLYFNDQLNSQ